MTATLFCLPLKKGKTETYKAMMSECVGPRKKDYVADKGQIQDLTMLVWHEK